MVTTYWYDTHNATLLTQYAHLFQLGPDALEILHSTHVCLMLHQIVPATADTHRYRHVNPDKFFRLAIYVLLVIILGYTLATTFIVRPPKAIKSFLS